MGQDDTLHYFSAVISVWCGTSRFNLLFFPLVKVMEESSSTGKRKELLL